MKRILILAASAGLISGCVRHHDAILFATNTQFGAKVGVNSQQIPEIQVGYNRQESALVPLFKADEENAGNSLGPNYPTTSGQLLQASAKLSQALQAGPGTGWAGGGSNQVVQAHGLITKAVEIEAKTQKATSAGLSQILDAAKSEMARLDLDRNGISILISLIAAETSKAARVVEYNETMKYVGIHDGAMRKDAYSVLGTFSGQGTAQSSVAAGGKAEAGGALAQFFATGVAAQLLAEKGGAALVSTSGKAPEQAQREAGALTADEVKAKLAIVNAHDKTTDKKAAMEAEVKKATGREWADFVRFGNSVDVSNARRALQAASLPVE